MRLARNSALLILMAVPELTFAHHSTALYDLASPITVTGVVERFDWSNPHAYIYLDVKTGWGHSEEWTIEMTSLRLLKSWGWSRDSISPGDVVRCTGGRAKTGGSSMLSTVVELSDGHKLRTL